MVKRTDALVAMALVVYGQLEVWAASAMPGVQPAAQRGLLAVCAFVATAAVAFRRTPIAAMAATTAAIEVAELAGTSQDAMAPFAALLLEAYALAVYASPRAGLVTFAAVIAVLAAGDPGNAAFIALVIGGPYVAGRVTRREREHAAELERVSAQLRAEQDRGAALAVELERARVARELHDILGHGLGVIVLQVGAVRRLLRPEQREERSALEAAERTGRDALADLRSVVHGLREDAPAPPAAGLDALDGLAEQVRRAGLPVELHVEGTARPLPPVLEHSAYRVVQEALTNTLKHAGPARARVLVRYEDDWLDLEVLDDGHPTANGSAGYGLIGMRERATLFGGELQAGPRPAGGFAVHARFPL